FARPVESVFSSRWLLDVGGKPVHSRIYLQEGAGGTSVLKQTSGDLADREGELLSLLDSPRFPRVLDSERRGVDSLLSMEAIDGFPPSATPPARPGPLPPRRPPHI